MPLCFLGEGRMDGKKEMRTWWQQAGCVQGRVHWCPDAGIGTGMKDEEGKK